ncbi:DNA-directed RNA polymerase subunit G [Sulfurisphaera tokodaii]|uniref:DNA-directed RNA polymerase subunit Rpo8 n=2 Tax=Sulfurisphaera tokodaii TaxID=111955 RepID=Q975U7_SULTO|nr:DNA-directed RNA polymerase subunit G [Sulfurisphaera tokodaii]BAB65302.1 DNA-directed RNA polymerase subunit G [Sulfurisphaera tokodaii str. 7]HII74999.1 DNA-directed RNA polymerase subunit G [Sulfurisphaera tokodaii]
MSVQVEGKVETTCKITSIDKGSLKGLIIIKMDCGIYQVEFDILESINIFKQEENVSMIISREKPVYTSNDFCAHGYLFYEKPEGNKILDQISLFGLIVKIYSEKGLIGNSLFKMMDHVYFCVKKSL